MKRLTRRSIQAGLSTTAVALTLASPAWAVYTVDTTSDANLTACTAAASDCSLRGAINNVNSVGADGIQFSIPGAAPHVIALTSDLPVINNAVTLDAQTGSMVNTSEAGPINASPAIVLDGEDHHTLVVAGGDSTIEGLVIYDAGGPAITLETKGNNFVQGNFIGTSPAGDAPVADPGGDTNRNRGPGIQILSGSRDSIGGPLANRNLISANGDFDQNPAGQGVKLSGGHGHTIDQNLIGTDKGGTIALGNRGVGVYVNGFNPGPPVGSSGEDIHDITVGGTSEQSGNVISGNEDSAIEFIGAGAGNKVLKNVIGTDYAGTMALPNIGQGAIRTNDADGLTIGDANGNGNLISGNGLFGLYLFGEGHVVQGNRIGTNMAGTAAIPNAGSGIEIRGNNITVGGTSGNARNVISGNTGHGIGSDGGQGNTIQGNLIGTSVDGAAALPNAQGGIDLGGATSNMIGGSAAGAGNFISGNAGFGLRLQQPEGPDNDSNQVLGNVIGA